MKTISLDAYVKEKGQEVVAEQFGLHQTAISKAIRTGRDITIIQHPDGSVEAKEVKPFPSKHPTGHFS